MNTIDLVRTLVKIAPDVLDVTLSTMGNPAAGLWKVIEKLRTNDAEIRTNAEKDFKNRIFETSKEEEDIFSLKRENIEEVLQYLIKEIKGIAESSVKLHDKDLHNEVMAFYRTSMPNLLGSNLDKPISWKKMAETRTELELIRLKVLWAESQQEAKRLQQLQKDAQVTNELSKLSLSATLVHVIVFVFLVIYIVLIGWAIVGGKQVWADNIAVPILGIPVSVIIWSALGSLANMLYKYYKGTYDSGIGNGFKWVLARPIVGVLMGAVVYLVMVTGLLLVGANAKPQVELFWLFAFIGGFSDSIFEGVVQKVGLLTVEQKLTEKDIEAIKSILLGEQTLKEKSDDSSEIDNEA
jgi:hypothetical protein